MINFLSYQCQPCHIMIIKAEKQEKMGQKFVYKIEHSDIPGMFCYSIKLKVSDADWSTDNLLVKVLECSGLNTWMYWPLRHFHEANKVLRRKQQSL